MSAPDRPNAAGLAALPRLMQLASPSLPIGGFAYSEGLEQAVERGVVRDEAGARDWVLGLLEHSVACLDAPLLLRMHDAFAADDRAAATALSSRLWVARESRELRDSDRWLGQALARVLEGLEVDAAAYWRRFERATLAATFALAGHSLALGREPTCLAYLWSWCEQITAAAIKLVPLGQRAGQALLFTCGERLPDLVQRASQLPEHDIAGGAPGLAVASARHEVQHTRLFRS